MTPAAAAASRPTFPVDLVGAVTNPRAANGTALCMACTADAPCCRRSCGTSRAHARVTHPFRFPQGNGYFKSKPCRAAPGLGLDHALLPVTHIGGPKKGPTDSGGLWFYYAPGCSDFLRGAVLTRLHVPCCSRSHAHLLRTARALRRRVASRRKVTRTSQGVPLPTACCAVATVPRHRARTAGGTWAARCSRATACTWPCSSSGGRAAATSARPWVEWLTGCGASTPSGALTPNPNPNPNPNPQPQPQPQPQPHPSPNQVRRVYPKWGALVRARRGLGLGANASVEEQLPPLTPNPNL